MSNPNTLSAAESGETSPEDAAIHAEDVVRRSGTSFYSAMRMLPPEKRAAMYAIYAFCREVDDIADEPGTVAEKTLALAGWREEITSLYNGHPRHPVAIALAGPLKRYGLAESDFQAVIDGMEMDACESIRIGDEDELILYCDRVACAVGRLSNRVFGVDEETGTRLAAALGEALQLTNILRDLLEDAGRNRLYLPADALRAAGIDEGNPLVVLRHPEIGRVCEPLAERAGRRFDEAEAILGSCSRQDVRPAIIMKAMYEAIYHKVLKRGWHDLSQPVKLSKLHKLWIAIRHGLL